MKLKVGLTFGGRYYSFNFFVNINYLGFMIRHYITIMKNFKNEITQTPSNNRPRLYVNVQPKDWKGMAAENRRAAAMRRPKKAAQHHIEGPTAKSRNGHSSLSTGLDDIMDSMN